MTSTLFRRRKSHDKRQWGLATAFYDDQDEAVRNHPFIVHLRCRQGFPPSLLPSDEFWDEAVIRGYGRE